jgi:protochlorophyllide reductase
MKAKSEKLSKDLWEITAKLVGMPSD